MLSAAARSKIIDIEPSGQPRAERTISLRRTRVKHAVWAGTVLVPFAVYLVWLWRTTLPSGTCSGIGFGCSLAGDDAVEVALVFLGVPLALLWFTGHLVIAVVDRRRRAAAEH